MIIRFLLSKYSHTFCVVTCILFTTDSRISSRWLAIALSSDFSVTILLRYDLYIAYVTGITWLPCYWNLALQNAGVSNRDNKLCSLVPWDSGLRKTELAIPSKNWKLQTRLLVREGAPHQQTRNCLKKWSKREGEKSGRGSKMGAWHQDRLADWLLILI
jgi:hypothetical protein